MKTKLLLAALLLAAAPLSAFAQGGIHANPDAIDYSALNNCHYTYADLSIAKARDYSDTTIAKLVKISEESGTSFSDLSDALKRGDTFITLCDRYGVPLGDLDRVQKQKAEVANYISAYETSGQYAFPDMSH